MGKKLSNEVLDLPWVEKYRPYSLSEIKSQTLTIQSLQEFVKKKSLPHLIFTGPAGTGKTSTAYALINDLLGDVKITQDLILERNASDESRMQDLPEIKQFVFHTKINENATFKFVILDESDNLSRDVQSAFRRIIEMAPSNVKFIFMCNYVERIIDPIISRCAIFRFYPLPRIHFEEQIKYIAEKENVPINKDIIDALYFISKGDMRMAINLFQTISAADESKKSNKIQIDPSVLYEISGFLAPDKFILLLKLCYKYDFLNAGKIIKTARGLSSRSLFRQFLAYLVNHEMRRPLLQQLLIELAEYDYRLTQASDPNLQYDGYLASFISLLNRHEKK